MITLQPGYTGVATSKTHGNSDDMRPALYCLLLLIVYLLSLAPFAIAADTPSVKLQARAFLLGAYDKETGLMRDQLRSKNLLQRIQPYNDSSSDNFFRYTGTEEISPALLNIEGDNAPVDWVLLELRSATDSAERLGAQAALLQRDGNLVNPQTGTAELVFSGVGDGEYYLVLRHRNHQDVMTKTAITLSAASTTIDFTSPSTLTTGNHARYESGGIAFMWPGDADASNTIIESGPGNDSSKLLQEILAAPGNSDANNNFVFQTYSPVDFDLDGSVVFAGPDNDANLLMSSVLLNPGNQGLLLNYVVRGEVPVITKDNLPAPLVATPNILLIISDDQGLDSSAQYSLTSQPPYTPRLNALADNGLVFENAWATPGCTTTRSSIITGKYGVNYRGNSDWRQLAGK